MNEGESVDARLMELEVKVAFQDNLIAELDAVIRSLQGELEQLSAAVAGLREELRGQTPDYVNEPPPHY